MGNLFDRVLRKLRERKLLRACRAILSTAPCEVADDGVILFSMIGTKVVLPYLVAAKTVRARLQRGRFVILDDGTLTVKDRLILAQHLGDPVVIAIGDVETGDCPRGGTWERLLTILDLREDAFVIQIDSDVVAIGPLDEVTAAITAGQSFTLRGEAGTTIQPLAEIAAWAAMHGDRTREHVQSAIELAMDRIEIPGFDALRYVRGCSGFAGFAPSKNGRILAERFSAAAERVLGKARWADWGSEQVTSNFLIANEPGSVLLPYDRYLNFWNTPIGADASLVHFIGTFRYHRGAYVQAVQQAIAGLPR